MIELQAKYVHVEISPLERPREVFWPKKVIDRATTSFYAQEIATKSKNFEKLEIVKKILNNAFWKEVSKRLLFI